MEQKKIRCDDTRNYGNVTMEEDRRCTIGRQGDKKAVLRGLGKKREVVYEIKKRIRNSVRQIMRKEFFLKEAIEGMVRVKKEERKEKMQTL